MTQSGHVLENGKIIKFPEGLKYYVIRLNILSDGLIVHFALR